jgi:tyrosine-protein phosphatase SIW14
MAKGDLKSKVEEEDLDAPPNFFCRLPLKELSKKVDRTASPPPLAFLQRIIENYNQQIPEQDESFTRQGTGFVADSRGEGSSSSSAGASRRSTGIDGARQEASRNGVASSSSSAASEIASPVVDNTIEDAPWFSQLANLPQVRSAGIPMIAPTASIRGSHAANRKPKAFETAPAPSSRGSEANGSSASLQVSGSLYPSADSAVGGNSSSSTDPFTSNHKAGDGKSHNFLSLAQPTTSISSAPLVPPENFAMVNSWVYRSSFPKKRHFPFLKTLGLKSVL